MRFRFSIAISISSQGVTGPCCVPQYSGVFPFRQASEAGKSLDLRKGGWSFVANPYPCATTIPSAYAQLSGLTGYDFASGEAKDFVVLWDSDLGAYTDTLLYVNAPERGYDNTWVDAASNPRAITLKMGQPCLLYRVNEGGAATIAFSAPYSRGPQ